MFNSKPWSPCYNCSQRETIALGRALYEVLTDKRQNAEKQMTHFRNPKGK